MNKINLLQKTNKFIAKRNTLITLFLIIIIASILSPRFLTLFNITNLLRQSSFIALISIGMMMALLTKGLDLSVGSLLAVAAVFSASLTQYGLFVAIVVPILITATLGLISGLIISKVNIQPFIVTLAMMLAGRGLALAYSHEKPIPVQSNKIFSFLGRGFVWEIPFTVIIVIIAYIIVWYILNHTSFGRRIYAIGGSEKAVKLMGINVVKVKVWVYVLSGVFAGLAGVLLTARLGCGSPNAGEGYELDAIAAAVIGGTLLTGGYGRIIGTLMGAIIITIIGNVLNLAGIISWYQWMLKGVIIIIAVLLQNKIRAVQTKLVSI